MYKRIKYSSRALNTDEGRRAVLNYYVIIGTRQNSSDGFPAAAYGCEIEMMYPFSDLKSESQRIEGICESREDIDRLMGKLCEGLVTPCTLYDIVYDHISE
ncbi:MAG: hypothetical protein IKD89_00095 [Clostridia bacterium]|nr:hypothetical protein [Clostridia bacterium]